MLYVFGFEKEIVIVNRNSAASQVLCPELY